MPNPDLLIIGAGAAGIAAARYARAQGRGVHILEARPRLGGRVASSHALGAPFDLGARWLHNAEDNPLTPLARALDIHLTDADAARQEVTFIGSRRATPAESAEYDAAFAAFEAALANRAEAPGPDIPAAEAAPTGGPWDATISAWLGEIISAWPLAAMSLRDYADNALNGRNLLPDGGMAALLERLAEGLPATLSAPVERLRWGGREAVAEGPFGTLRARAVLCTVPTTPLAEGVIRFDPPLPAEILQAASDLPLGAVLKVGFRAAGGDRLGFGPFTSTDRRVNPGEPLVTINLWPFGGDQATCYLGGPAAADLEAEGDAAAEAFMRDELARRFGGAASTAFASGAVVTTWLRDPYSRGVYSHARVGRAGARAMLAAPLADGRLVFAGEATDAGLAGTVGGAWRSGEAAARAALAALA
jgi:monoamine oxidase